MCALNDLLNVLLQDFFIYVSMSAKSENSGNSTNAKDNRGNIRESVYLFLQ